MEGAWAMKLFKKAKKNPRCTLEIEVPGLLEPVPWDSLLLPGLVPWLGCQQLPTPHPKIPTPPV